jgi:tetratricopeptide (TPR) repeat protein
MGNCLSTQKKMLASAVLEDSKHHGSHHSHTESAKKADTCQETGKVLEVEHHVEEAEGNSKVARDYNNRAIVLEEQGSLDDAMKFYEKSLEFTKQPTSVAKTNNNMATVLHKQGKLDEAMQLLEKSLELKRTTLGEDHPLVAHAYYNMGNVLKDQGHWDQSVEMYEKSLTIASKTKTNSGEASHAPDDYHTAEIYHNMGIVLQEQGELEKATKSYKHALKIEKECLDKNSSAAAETYFNIAVLLETQGNAKDSVESYRHAANIYENNHDDEETATTYLAMVDVLHSLGKVEEAKELQDKAGLIQKRRTKQEVKPMILTPANS